MSCSLFKNTNGFSDKLAMTQLRNLLKIIFIFMPLVCIGQIDSEQLTIPKNANYTISGSYQHASLMGWAMRSEMQMLNRSSNPYGIVTDRGWMYNYTDRMYDEYALNRMTFSPTLSDDYMWYRSPNAVRVVAGDYDDLEIHTNTEIQLAVQLMPRHSIKLWGYTEHNTVLHRGFMNVAYQFNVTKDLQAGLRHTFGSSKMDLDISLFGQWGNAQNGYAKVEVTMTDYLNNYTKSRVSSPNYVSDTLRSYSDWPVLVQFSGVSPQWKGLRAEVFAAFQSKGTADIISISDRLDKYKYMHEGMFAGGLLEYQFPYITLGSVYKYMFSGSERDTSSNGRFSPSYTSEQTEIHQGFYLIVNASQVTWDSWFWLVDYNETKDGSRFSTLAEIDRKFSHDEKRVMMQNRLRIRPDYKGLIIDVEHLADYRKKKISVPNPAVDEIIPLGLDPFSTTYPSAFHNHNNRIVLSLGFQFHPRAFVQLAYALDLDLDLHRILGGERYDTGFVKLEYRW